MTGSKLTINKYGDKVWMNEEGKIHREDGPALENLDGSKVWYINGKCHREDGPAFEREDDEYKAWWVNGERHRIDGPAREDNYGWKEWWHHNKFINCSSQEEFERLIQLLPFE